MIPIFVLTLGLFLFGAISFALLPIDDLYNQHRAYIVKYGAGEISNAIVEQYQVNPNAGLLKPTDITTLSGYEHLRFNNPYLYTVEVAPAVNSGIWTFSRMGLWFESPRNSVGFDQYLSDVNNLCGTGSFYDSSSWCGRKQSIWSKIETREFITHSLLAEKHRLVRVMRKFLTKYSHDPMFILQPDGYVGTLANLVGYTGNAYGCNGVFEYNTIPFGCEDLFNHWGNPIVINKLSAEHMALVSRTGIQNSSGAYVRVAEEINLE